MCTRRPSTGFTLIEVVLFIIIMGIAFVGMLILYNRVTSASVDPIVRKQALAIASSLLEEIELHAFTFCDPDDPNVYTATGPPPTGCTTVEGIGIEGGETRYSVPRFDNVSDYNGFCMGPGLPVCPDAVIRTAAGATISDLATYRVDASVATNAANEPGPDVPAGEALLITVTATHAPTGITASLQSYRVRYAPNSP